MTSSAPRLSHRLCFTCSVGFVCAAYQRTNIVDFYFQAHFLPVCARAVVVGARARAFSLVFVRVCGLCNALCSAAPRTGHFALSRMCTRERACARARECREHTNVYVTTFIVDVRLKLILFLIYIYIEIYIYTFCACLSLHM